MKRNSCILIQEHIFESVVCEMAAISLGHNVLKAQEKQVSIFLD